MLLFDDLIDPQRNLLPKEGTVNYYGRLLNHEKSEGYYNSLLNNIEWKNDVAIIFGKRIETKRKVGWYAEKPFEYTYSNNTKLALPWTKELLELKKLVEQKTGETFNSCLLNLYHNGSEGMAWHSDGEKELENDEILELWSALIDRINEGDSDSDLLLSKLESLSTAEAEFLIQFSAGKHRFINVNSFLSAISFRSRANSEFEREQELALSLKEKGIITQPFPVLRAIFGALFPILLFLLSAELYRDYFTEIAINVSSANNVILLAVLGVLVGFSFIPFLRQRTRLTWIGTKLCKGLNHKSVKET